MFQLRKKKIEKSEDFDKPEVIVPEEEHLVFKDFFSYILQKSMDVTKKIDVSKGGNLGSLINQMMDKVHISIKSIISQIVDVSQSAFNLGNSVDELQESIENQSILISSISESTTQLSEDIQNISDKTKHLAEQSARAIMSTESGNSRMMEFTTTLNKVGEEIVSTQNFMETLKESTESIHSLTELINDITSKLDILSINASIEAARAGFAGKGFAVLAKEIRKLSSQSESAVSRVNNIVDTVIQDMSVVDSSLSKAGTSINSCLSKSNIIIEDFKNISSINKDLNVEVENISYLLESQEASSSGIRDAAETLSMQEKPILSLVAHAEDMSKQLHDTVDNVLNSASFKLDWHKIAEDSLLGLKQKLKNFYSKDVESFLIKQFVALPFVELFYVMDKRGHQITSNIVNPRFESIISRSGLGEDRSGKDYVKLLNSKCRSYVSGIYVSSASQDLCVTASIIFEVAENQELILAADMNIKDFIKLK